jgi:hypothetical protein
MEKLGLIKKKMMELKKLIPLLQEQLMALFM